MSASFAICRLKALVTCPVEKSDGRPRPFVGLEDIGSGTGSLIADAPPAKAALDSVLHSPGDVLFSKLRPYLAKSFMATEVGTATGELLVLRPHERIDQRFLLYTTLSSPWLEWADTTSYGSKMPRTSWEAMSEFRLALPPLDEQRRIADFLDAYTAVSASISSHRSRQRELLLERRWLVLRRAIGNVEAELIPLRRLLDEVVDGPFGSAFSSNDYADEGAR
ncbi:MAG: restriction endonuclease subunit S [Pseudonocardia sp.]